MEKTNIEAPLIAPSDPKRLEPVDSKEKWEKMSDEAKTRHLRLHGLAEGLWQQIVRRRTHIIEQIQAIRNEKAVWEKLAFAEGLLNQTKLMAAAVSSNVQIGQHQQVLDGIQNQLQTERQALDGMSTDWHRLDEAQKQWERHLDHCSNLESLCSDFLMQLEEDQPNFDEWESRFKDLIHRSESIK